jgi:hypothetical protein
MDLEQILKEKIKPELNHLYTARPFRIDGRWDHGWFSREHAFHCFFLCRLLKMHCEIRLGDLSVHDAGGGIVASTFNSPTDHAWVMVNDVCPVDLSLNFQHYATALPPLDSVFGHGVRGHYLVTYTQADASLVEDTQQLLGLYRIRYVEKTTIGLSAEDLLQDPYRFLVPSRHHSLTAEFGRDILDRVTLHLYRVAIGEIKPLSPYLKPAARAFQKIQANNPHATDKIRERLQEPPDKR